MRIKQLITRTILSFALCSPLVYAQPGNRVSLQLGTVTVWLGEDKATAKQQIEAAGLHFNSFASSGQVGVSDANNVYNLHFDNGKLVYADRTWLPDDGSNALPSVMDAFTSLIDQGANSCRIEHLPITSPDKKLDRVIIECGQRGILLTYGTVMVAGKTYTANEIYESIGRYQAD